MTDDRPHRCTSPTIARLVGMSLVFIARPFEQGGLWSARPPVPPRRRSSSHHSVLDGVDQQLTVNRLPEVSGNTHHPYPLPRVQRVVARHYQNRHPRRL